MLAGTALLAACGGGGGGGGDDPAQGQKPTALDQVQGFWSGPAATGGTVEAIFLRNGEVWAVVQSGGAVRSVGKAQGAIDASGFGATGVLTDLASGTSQALALQATTVAPKATLTGTLSAPAPASAMTWTYNARYDTPQPLADFAGRWTSIAGGQRITTSWDISAAGAVTGTSSTGCTYSGALAVHAQASSTASLALTEQCPGSEQGFSGIATLNEARSQASFILGDGAGTKFSFVALQK